MGPVEEDEPDEVGAASKASQPSALESKESLEKDMVTENATERDKNKTGVSTEMMGKCAKNRATRTEKRRKLNDEVVIGQVTPALSGRNGNQQQRSPDLVLSKQQNCEVAQSGKAAAPRPLTA